MKKSCFLLCLSVLLLCSGCLSVKYQHADHYLLHVKKSHRIKNSKKIIKIEHATINQQFSSINFIYRDTDIHYLTDYYNAFLIPPATQIQQLIEQYLNSTHLFDYVADEGSFGYTNYALKTKILNLYADYQDTNNPKAVITIRFILLNPNRAKKNILLNKIFKAQVPLKNKDTKNLINAWNQGLTSILKRLTSTLQIILK